MTLPIGTEVTYQGVRHTIIGYSVDGWYRIRPVGSTSIHYNTVSGKYFSDIVEPAKGDVYNLDYPADAINGETITINASVINVGDTSGDFSLRLLINQIVLVTSHVGIVPANEFAAPVNLQVTMPSSGASANLAIQCIRHT